MAWTDPEYGKTYAHNWYLENTAARRVAWITANGPCKRCGSSENLEVDHIDPMTKDPSLRVHRAASGKRMKIRLWTWPDARRNAELTKCQVLCHDCHVKKTAIEKRAAHPIVHGTRNGYNYFNCHCQPCRDARQAYRRRMGHK